MTSSFPPPRIRCGKLNNVAGKAVLADFRSSFAHCEGVELRQGWRAVPEAGFRPGRVGVGHDGGSLCLLAELGDDEVFNPVEGFNEPFFRYGDVFEIFLRPEGSESYSEFHVGPAGQLFQLRIPSKEAFRSPRPQAGVPEEWFLSKPEFEARVWLRPSGWTVFCRLPGEFAGIDTGDGCRFSFSRYDYTRGHGSPVLSSSSPHPVVDFHRQEDWGRLEYGLSPACGLVGKAP